MDVKWILITLVVAVGASCSPVASDSKKDISSTVRDKNVEQVTAHLKKKLAPSTPQTAVKGFFDSLSHNRYSQAYAYISQAIRAMPKEKFLRDWNGPSFSRRLLRNNFQVHIKSVSLFQDTAQVICQAIVPDQVKIGKVRDAILTSWMEREVEDTSEEKLAREIQTRIYTENGKVAEKFLVALTFHCYLVKNKKSWWILYSRTYDSFQNALDQQGRP